MQRLTLWGNSTGMRLPCEVAQAAGLKPGDYVYVPLLDLGDTRMRPAKNVHPTQPPTTDGKEDAYARPPEVTMW